MPNAHADDHSRRPVIAIGDRVTIILGQHPSDHVILFDGRPVGAVVRLAMVFDANDVDDEERVVQLKHSAPRMELSADFMTYMSGQGFVVIVEDVADLV